MESHLDHHWVLLLSKFLQDDKVPSVHHLRQYPNPSPHRDKVRLDNTNNPTEPPHLKTLVSPRCPHSLCQLVSEPQIHQPHPPHHLNLQPQITLNLLPITLSSQLLQKVGLHFVVVGETDVS